MKNRAVRSSISDIENKIPSRTYIRQAEREREREREREAASKCCSLTQTYKQAATTGCPADLAFNVWHENLV